jgi:hypothetical protein
MRTSSDLHLAGAQTVAQQFVPGEEVEMTTKLEQHHNFQGYRQ